MGAEANGEGTQTVEATAGSEVTDTAQTVGADEAAGAQHAQVLGAEDAGNAIDYESAVALGDYVQRSELTGYATKEDLENVTVKLTDLCEMEY